MRHVDKCKPDRLPCLQIDWQINIIVVIPKLSVNHTQQIFLCKLVRHILYHESRPLHDFIVSIKLCLKDSIQIHSVVLWAIFVMSFLNNFRHFGWKLKLIRRRIKLMPRLSQDLLLKHLLHLLVEHELLILKTQVLTLKLIKIIRRYR